MATYGYARVSTQQQVEEGKSLEVQQRMIEGWATMHGETISATFIETGVSGSIPIGDRPQGSLLMAGLKRGDKIVTTKLDRLFRSPLDALQTVEKVRAKGVELHSIDLGELTGNGMGRVFMVMASCFAEWEREKIKDRILDVKADQKRQGAYLGGKVPFGYRLENDGEKRILVPVEDEQAIIARIHDLAPASLRTIRSTLIEEYGRALSLDAINRVIKDGRASA